ncbi:MAG: hypothetical protein KDJ52_09770 [Anaerolineae bacterium]|nr:hypothetical protein [Anaerolineae bacterium]
MARDQNVMSPSTWLEIMQNINPLALWWQNATGQIGLVNINYKNSANPTLEKEIVEETASYGRQLGRINDVVEILLQRIPDDSLSEPQRTSKKSFEKMRADIALVKAQHNSLPAKSVKSFIDALEQLKQDDHPAYEQVKAQLMTALTDNKGANG